VHDVNNLCGSTASVIEVPLDETLLSLMRKDGSRDTSTTTYYST
jgi:hypothetical protein